MTDRELIGRQRAELLRDMGAHEIRILQECLAVRAREESRQQDGEKRVPSAHRIPHLHLEPRMFRPGIIPPEGGSRRTSSDANDRA